MPSLNRLGLLTALITATVSLGIAQLYFTFDRHVNLSHHYASLFKWLPTEQDPLNHTSAVAGIKDVASPTPVPTISSKGTYTTLYIAEQGSDVPAADLFSKERLAAFITQHSAPLSEASLKHSLPLSSQTKIQLLTIYSEIPIIHSEELLALTTVPKENMPAAAQPLIGKLESALLLLERTGTSTDVAPLLERHAGLLTLALNNVRLVADSNRDFVGSILGGAQLKEIAVQLEQSTTNLQKAITDPTLTENCGLCISSDDLLNAAANAPAVAPSSSIVPMPSIEPSPLP